MGRESITQGAWAQAERCHHGTDRSRTPSCASCSTLGAWPAWEQPLTARLLPRKACRKADLPAPRAPSTLHRKTFLWVCPFSRSIFFSRVTGRREASESQERPELQQKGRAWLYL